MADIEKREFNKKDILEIVRDSYIKLKEKNPNHELLKLVEILNVSGVYFTNDYLEKYVNYNDKALAQAHARYINNLEEAIETNK